MAALERIKRKEMYLCSIRLEDMARRSYGVLRNARIMSYEEAMLHLSRPKLGIELSYLAKKDFGYTNNVSPWKSPSSDGKGDFLDERSSNIPRQQGASN